MDKYQYEKMFRALGDGHRLVILDQLTGREMNAGEILETVNVVQSTLSHHMKTLCDSGLVTARRSGKWTCYNINAEAFREAEDFLLRLRTKAEKTLGQPEEPVSQPKDGKEELQEPSLKTDEITQPEEIAQAEEIRYEMTGETDRNPKSQVPSEEKPLKSKEKEKEKGKSKEGKGERRDRKKSGKKKGSKGKDKK